MFRRWIMVLTALGFVACDVPTEPPMWEQTWVVPGEPILLGVAEFLPAGLTVSADGEAFRATVQGFDVNLSVAEMCEACVPLDGTTAPKPAFTDTFTTSTGLPPRLVSAHLVGDHFDLRLVHQLSFDPLRPASDPDADRGHIVVEVTSAGNVVARDSISGEDVPFPADSVLTPDLAIEPADIGDSFDVRVIVHSPEGDPIEIDTSQSIRIRLMEGPLVVSGAVIQATAVTLPGTTTTIELEGVDSTLVDRIQRGALRMDVQDPFGVGGELNLDFDIAGTVIRKTAQLAPENTRVDVEFTGTELRSILDAGSVDVTTTGTLAAPDGTISVAPGQALVLDSNLEIVVLVGGSEGDS